MYIKIIEINYNIIFFNKDFIERKDIRCNILINKSSGPELVVGIAFRNIEEANSAEVFEIDLFINIYECNQNVIAMNDSIFN